MYQTDLHKNVTLSPYPWYNFPIFARKLPSLCLISKSFLPILEQFHSHDSFTDPLFNGNGLTCASRTKWLWARNCPVKLTGPVITGTFEKRVPGPKRLVSEETLGSSGWEVSETRKFAIKGVHKGQITLTRDNGRNVSFVISLRWKFDSIAVEITRNFQVP